MGAVEIGDLALPAGSPFCQVGEGLGNPENRPPGMGSAADPGPARPLDLLVGAVKIRDENAGWRRRRQIQRVRSGRRQQLLAHNAAPTGGGDHEEGRLLTEKDPQPPSVTGGAPDRPAGFIRMDLAFRLIGLDAGLIPGLARAPRPRGMVPALSIRPAICNRRRRRWIGTPSRNFSITSWATKPADNSPRGTRRGQ